MSQLYLCSGDFVDTSSLSSTPGLNGGLRFRSLWKKNVFGSSSTGINSRISHPIGIESAPVIVF